MADLLQLLGQGAGQAPAQSSDTLNFLAKTNQASAPGLALFQQGMAADAMQSEAAAKQKLVTDMAGAIRNKDYQGALSLYSQLDPEGVKTLLPQISKIDPNMAQSLSFADTEGQLSSQTGYGANARQLLDARLAAEAAMNKDNLAARQKETAAKGPMLTPGQEALDKAFAKEVGELDNQGGFATIDKSLKQLEKAKTLFKSSDNVSGPIVGLLPKAARDVLVPESGRSQDAIQDVVMATLRPILGAQFTAEEGKRVVENTFNPRLPEKENLRRLELLQQTLKEQAAAKKASVDYFKKNGTLTGYEGPRPVSNVDGIQSMLAEKAGVEIKEIKGKVYQKVPGGWALVK